MKAPAPSEGRRPTEHAEDDSVPPPAHQGLADFAAGCAAFGWNVDQVTHRVLRLTSANGSVLLASTEPTTFFDTLRRIADVNDFAKRHRRP